MSTGWVLVDVLGFRDLDNSPAGLQWQLVVMETNTLQNPTSKLKIQCNCHTIRAKQRK